MPVPEIVSAVEDDPLMQSYYPAVPSWLSSLPSPAEGDGGKRGNRPPGGFNPNLLEQLKLGAQAAAHEQQQMQMHAAAAGGGGARNEHSYRADGCYRVEKGGFGSNPPSLPGSGHASQAASQAASPRGGAPVSSGLNGRPFGGYGGALGGGERGQSLANAPREGRASAPFLHAAGAVSDRGTPTQSRTRPPLGQQSRPSTARPSTAGPGTPSGIRPPSTGPMRAGAPLAATVQSGEGRVSRVRQRM